MAKADLHIHSKHSEQLSEQFLRQLGAAESYTEPEYIYAAAKARGMSFVTITDHNRISGALELQKKHPEDVFTGIETTTYFPEDGYRVHALIYGLTEADYEEVQRVRMNIYDLRELIRERGLAYSIAHATYAGNDVLSIDKLEKLILMFDVFEGINGGCGAICNRTWMDILNGLTPAKIEDLYRRHRIDPMSSDPWVKGLTGGTDDHSGLFVARTHTVADAKTVGEFLQSLKERKTAAEGCHSDFQSLVFTLCKIGYDFSKHKSPKTAHSTFSRMADLVFTNRPLRLRDKIALRTLKYKSRRKTDIAQRMMVKLVDDFRRDGSLPVDEKMSMLYDTLADMSDGLIRVFLNSIDHDLKKGNVIKLVKSLSSTFSGLLIALPFVATFRHMYKGRRLIEELKERLGGPDRRERKVLWFTDSLNDLTGFSFTSHFRSTALRIATSMNEADIDGALKPLVMNFPLITELHLPTGDQETLKVPSLLSALKQIYAYDPDEIYISTHGPLGLFGLLVAQLLNVKSVGVYHTDYYQKPILEVLGDTSAGASMYEAYVRWFYSRIDEIRLPDAPRMDAFENLGLDRRKMSVFTGDWDQCRMESAG
jgi:hypothetical protein